MSGMDRLTDEQLDTLANAGVATPWAAEMAREPLAHRRASQAAPAPQKPVAWAETDHKGRVIGVSMSQYPWHPTPLYAAPAPSDGLREAAATILAVLQDPDSLPIEKHPDWQAIYNAMTADHNESVEISGDSWHDWPSILIAGLEVMAQDSAALSASPAKEGERT